MKPTRPISQEILQNYDVRGIFDQTLFLEDAYIVGHAFCKLLKTVQTRTIVVGRDDRVSSPHLMDALMDGIRDAGFHVIYIGMVPTPVVYYATAELPVDGSIMITASHNPHDHNGFKLHTKNGPFYGDQIQHIKDVKITPCAKSRRGALHTLNITPQYIERITNNLAFKKKMKVIWDTGNGACGPVLRELVNRLPGHHTILYEDSDPYFPNHHPDPNVEKNMLPLKKKVMQTKADVGIAFDGDGDRLGIVDNAGNIWYAEDLLFLFTEHLKALDKNAHIVVDVKITQAYIDWAREQQHLISMSRTGHSSIKQMMYETEAEFAGEYSGHFFFSDVYYGFDDALYAALRLLSIMNILEAPLSAYHKTIPRFHNIPEVSVSMPTHAIKDKAIQAIQDKLKEENVRYNDIDGIRVESHIGWWLIRGSNTRPALTARAEGSTKEHLQEMQKEMEHYINFAKDAVSKETAAA